MKAVFLADADLRSVIVRALRNREPSIDFLGASGSIPDGMPDPEVLALAADLGRVLVSHDYETMPRHFYSFIEWTDSPGLVLIPQSLPTGGAVEELLLVWSSLESWEFRNRIVYLPL